MTYELAFSMAGALSAAGWLVLMVSPLAPAWADRIAGVLIPVLLSVAYLATALSTSSEGGGFGSFAEITALFSNPGALLAGWIHFLAFDLVVGAWICRTARAEGIPFWMVLPCLPVAFLLGPVGFLGFMAVRGVHRQLRRYSSKRSRKASSVVRRSP